MMTTTTKGGQRLTLTGREVAEQVTCATCWAAGYAAVLYIEPNQPRPASAFCPVCGVERRRVAGKH